MRRSDAIALWVSLVAVMGLVGLVIWFLAGGEGFDRPAQLRSAVDASLNLLAVSAGVGVVSMAIVQFWKIVLRGRGRFHAGHLAWLFEGENGSRLLSPYQAVVALDISLEQVIALVGSYVERDLASPKGTGPVVTRLLKFTALETYGQEMQARTAAENAALVRENVETSLDSLHLLLQAQWRLRIRLQAASVAAAIGIALILFIDVGPATKTLVVAASLILGGFFSWLSRDVVAGIERWRDQ